MTGHVLTDLQIPGPTRRFWHRWRPFGPSGKLIRFDPPPATFDQVVGRRVSEVSPNVGTYGMGGPGFFGLGLDGEWLVVSVWGAASWMHCEGRLVEDMFFEQHNRPRPWISNGTDDLSPRIVGSDINAFQVSRCSLSIGFSSGTELAIEESPENRPILEGSKEPRAFAPDEDLRRGVFLSPTAEIWV